MLRFSGALNSEATVPIMVLLLMVVAGAAVVFPLSFVTRTNVIIGLILFPFSIFFTGSRRINYVYLTLCIASSFMALRFGVRMFYFLLLVFMLLFFLELCIGRLNCVIIFLTALMSPFFEQVAIILGFPLRLKISAMAGEALSAIGMPVVVEGNAILLNGGLFTVDQACAGLNMLSLSLLMGVFLIVYRYRAHKRLLSLPVLTLYFLAGIFLNVVANLFRIIVLVVFAILPGNPMHDIAGLLIFLVYVVAPLFFLSDFFVRRFGKESTDVSGAPEWTSRCTGFLTCFVILIFSCAFAVRERRAQSGLAHATVEFTMEQNHAFVTEQIQDGITRITGDDCLVYVKPIAEFFTGEHTPLMCWKGSGYVFAEVREQKAGDTSVYVGKLKRNEEELFTAWWYSNGVHKTISQADWRFRMLRGEERFCLINVTAADEHTLMKKVATMSNHKELNITP